MHHCLATGMFVRPLKHSTSYSLFHLPSGKSIYDIFEAGTQMAAVNPHPAFAIMQGTLLI